MKPGVCLQAAVGLAMLFAVGGFLLATLFAFYIWSILFGFVDCQPDLIWFDDRQTNLIRFVDADPIKLSSVSSIPDLGCFFSLLLLIGLDNLQPKRSSVWRHQTIQ